MGDPGLGVSGTVELGQTADASGFVYLQIRAFQDDDETWDPTQALPEVEVAFSETRTLSGTGDFPAGYELNSLGTVDKRRWRVLAWLSSEEGSEAPGSGDWWGTARFSFDGCGSHGGFCDYIEGVDVTLDARVP
jgi:hypothetical protein